MSKELRMAQNVFMVAFDHVVEFDEVFAEGDSPTAEEVETIKLAKQIVFRGVKDAVAEGLPADAAPAVLIDDKYASAVVPEAHDAGIAFSMPVDAPFGGVVLAEGWRDLLLRHRPTWAKPLLWYNVEGDKDRNAEQIRNTLVLQDWLQANNQKLLLEFLIRPEEHQLRAVGGDADRYRTEVLPGLIVAAIHEAFAAGIRPDLWKIEGVPTAEGTKAIGDAALATGADALVLGSGADVETVGAWLGQAARTDGYGGFAVGRTIWQDAARAWKTDRDDDAFARQVSSRYRQLATQYAPSNSKELAG
jgi:myo-inositol catabolism protein IolC